MQVLRKTKPGKEVFIKFCDSLKKYFLKSTTIPSYIITTGKRMAGVSVALKFILKDKVITIHIQNPKLPFEYFDLLLVSEHYYITSKNFIQTKGALTFFNFNELNKNNYCLHYNLHSSSYQ